MPQWVRIKPSSTVIFPGPTCFHPTRSFPSNNCFQSPDWALKFANSPLTTRHSKARRISTGPPFAAKNIQQRAGNALFWGVRAWHGYGRAILPNQREAGSIKQAIMSQPPEEEANFLPRRPIEKIKSDVNENQGRNSCFFGRHSAVYGSCQFGRRPRLE